MPHDGARKPDLADERIERALNRLFDARPSEPLTGSMIDAIEKLGGLPAGALALEQEPRVPDGGRYFVGREVGRGGVGVVFACLDRDLDREVAIKVLRRDRASSGEMVSRFLREAQVEGQLEHPGVAPVYDLGFAEGTPFYAMKLVTGRPLSALLSDPAGRVAGMRGLLRVFERTCQTVAYAHSRGVIHRDLKPSNVMVGDFGEVQVLDWGMAKFVARESEAASDTGGCGFAAGGASAPGLLFGTLAYMPPEQALGDPALDERADVFALGGILCEILTGAPPYSGTGPELYVAARDGRLDEAHGRLAACVSEPVLAALARRCLSADPAARPAGAKEVAEAVSGHLAAEQERARRAEREALEARLRGAREQERAAREGRRAERERRSRRWTLAAAAALTLALLAGSGLAVFERGRSRERAERAAAAVSGSLRVAAALEGAGDLEAALEHARDAVARGRAGGAPAETVAQAESAAERLASCLETAQEAARRAEEDRKLLRALEIVRLSALTSDPTDPGATQGIRFVSDLQAIDSVYSCTFRDAGIDVARLTAPELADAVSARTCSRELAAEFTFWAAVRRGLNEGDPISTALLDAAELADPAPLSVRLRAAVRTAGRDEFVALARTADPREFPPLSIQLLGRCLCVIGETEEAARFLTRAVSAHPGDPWILADLAGCSLARPELAVRCMLSSLGLRPDVPRLMDITAVMLALAKDYPEALRLLEAAETLGARDAQHLCWHAYTLTRMGLLEEALGLFDEALALEPDEPAILFWIGSVLGDLGRYADSAECLRQVLERRPGNSRARMNYATSLCQMGRTAEALREARTAMGGDAPDATMLLQFGWILYHAREFREATEVAERFVLLRDADPKGYYLLGVICCDGTGDYDGAIDYFGKAILHGEDPGFFRRSLGLAYRHRGDLPRAIEAYREAAAVYEGRSRAEALLDLGYTLGLAGDWRGCISAYRECVATVNDYMPARIQIVFLLADCPDPACRDLAEARAWAEQGVALRPDGPVALAALGLVMFREGRYEDAKTLLERSVRVLERQETYHLLSMVHSRLGLPEEARRCLARAAAMPPPANSPPLIDYGPESQRLLEEAGR